MSEHGDRTRAGMERARARGAQIGRRVEPEQLRTYARVLGMLADGIGYTAIARQLNAEQVPTPHGGRWWPSTIQAIERSATAARL